MPENSGHPDSGSIFTVGKEARLFKYGIPLLIFFVISLGLFAVFKLDDIEHDAEHEAKRSLEIITLTTHNALAIWAEDLIRRIEQVSTDPALSELVQAQLRVEKSPQALKSSEYLHMLRRQYEHYGHNDIHGFFVISPEYQNIASYHDANIGTRNLIADHFPLLLEKVFQGQTLVVPPMRSDIPLQRDFDNALVVNYPTMFVAAPVRNSTGEVIAAYTLRINPFSTFDRITNLGSEKGKVWAYVFDERSVRGEMDTGMSLPAIYGTVPSHVKPELMALLGNSDRNAGVFDMDGYTGQNGVEVYGHFLWVPELNLGLAIELDKAFAMETLNDTRSIVLYLYLVSFILALFIMVGITWSSRRRELRLAQSKAEMEHLVKKRTQDLIKSNRDLMRSKEHLNAMFSAIPDAIMIVDQQGVIHDVNTHTVSLLQYSSGELIGMRVEQLMPERHRSGHPALRKSVLKVANKQIKPNRTLVAKARDGSEIDVDVNISTYEVGGELVSVVGLRDVRDRIRSDQEKEKLQQQLERSQRIETVGRLTGGVAHDFNNILAAILGYAELSRETLADNPEQVAHYLDNIYESGIRGSQLVKQLLSFSRGEPTKLHPVDVSLIIDSTFKVLRATIPSTITMDQNIESKEQMIVADQTQLHQAVMNMVVNARDAMDGPGHIEVGSRRVCGDFHCSSCYDDFNGDYIEVYVRDTGPGIYADRLARIFEPFYTTKEVGRGTGMGLSIVHGIVHNAGGHVIVESVPGEGSCFRLMFPALAQEDGLPHQQSTSGEYVESVDCSGGSVLLVDDEAAITAFMTDLLHRWGYKVKAVNSAYDALAVFQQTPGAFDLVITDQAMPGMEGSALAQHLIELQPSLPIILVTGFSDSVDDSNFSEFGIAAYLNKPIDNIQLKETIEKLLSRASIGGS